MQGLIRTGVLAGIAGFGASCGAKDHTHDAGSDEDATAGDAAPADAVPDAIRDAAPRVDAETNPAGISFAEITSAISPAPLPGGRADPHFLGRGSGVALGDVDGDGDLEVVLARCDDPAGVPGGPATLLWNGGGDFTASAAFAPHFDDRCAHGVALADYDGDGDLDVFVAADGPDTLLRYDGGDAFTDVTAATGLAGPADDLSTDALWADVNADGLLDLYVLAHTRSFPAVPDDPLVGNRLHLQRGDGTFVEVGVAAGAAGNGTSQAALVADLDGDADLEIYVANDRFAIEGLFPDPNGDPDAWLDPTGFDTDGVPAYADRTAAYATDGPRASMGVALADLPGGDPDRPAIYVTDWGRNHLQVWDDGAGAYVERAADWGVEAGRSPENVKLIGWSARFLDLDRDGRDELFVVNGQVAAEPNCDGWHQMDVLLRPGDADPSAFENITPASGLPWIFDCPPQSDYAIDGRGAAWGDLDGDGDLDLAVSPYVEAYRFFRNDTVDAGHAVRVRARGTVAAVDPVGAVLEVTRGDGTVARRALYAGGDTASQSDRVLEVALGDDPTVQEAWLRWPSGFDQRLDQRPEFAIDTTLAITEPAWLVLSARAATAADSPVVLTYRPADETGAFLGASGSGRAVTVTRSDGVAVTVTDHGDGTYTAPLPHPGTARTTTLAITVDGASAPIRPSLRFQ